MSTVEPPVPATVHVGLGYGIAIAVSILVLISTIMLASYACVRVKTSGLYRGRNNGGGNDRDYGGGEYGVGGANSVDPIMVVVGLDKPVIDSYPKLVLGESRRLPRPNTGPCSICLADYQPKDTVRCIPDCHHCFHAECVDEWLKMSATCPLCRNSPAPSAGSTPISTPLSDLVPLTINAR